MPDVQLQNGTSRNTQILFIEYVSSQVRKHLLMAL